MALSPSPFKRPLSMRRSSSSYLLLTAENSDAAPIDVSLPRPTYFLTFTLLASLDAVSALVFTILSVKHSQPSSVALCIWHWVRASALLANSLSRRIRERAWLVVLMTILTFLLILFYANALIQQLPTSGEQGEPAHRLDHAPHILPYILLSHLVFSCLHWIAFVALIGVRRETNPFGLGIQSFKTSWRERLAEVQYEDVPSHDQTVATIQASQLVDEDDQDLEVTDESEDEITDIAPVVFMPASATLRSRISRQSLRQTGYDTF